MRLTISQAKRMDPVERLLLQIDQRSPDECWPWQGYIGPSGHGRLGWKGRSSYLAHRAAYETLVGPIPGGLPLDHTCHNGSGCPGGDGCLHRRCCNPAHLEPVTLLENVRRGESFAAKKRRQTHCIHGHEFTGENTLIGARGMRVCRVCLRRRRRETDARRRGKPSSERTA